MREMKNTLPLYHHGHLSLIQSCLWYDYTHNTCFVFLFWQRYFLLERGILMYGKTLADVSIHTHTHVHKQGFVPWVMEMSRNRVLSRVSLTIRFSIRVDWSLACDRVSFTFQHTSCITGLFWGFSIHSCVWLCLKYCQTGSEVTNKIQPRYFSNNRPIWPLGGNHNRILIPFWDDFPEKKDVSFYFGQAFCYKCIQQCPWHNDRMIPCQICAPWSPHHSLQLDVDIRFS